MLLTTTRTDLPAPDFVARHGEVFAVFDAATQDSGNISYGVRVGDARLFVKTAGDPHGLHPHLSHADRLALLRNATQLARSVTHAALPELRNVVESSDGPLLVYTWVAGELLGTTRARRSDPASAYARFRGLPTTAAIVALDSVLALHAELARRGWIASDFYDGSLLYDFTAGTMHVVDLDHYRRGPFTNESGRMFGSTRFMAPEEHTLGARIDERTTVFTMGRTILELLPAAPEAIADIAARACAPEPERRFETVARFYDAWATAVRPFTRAT